MEFRSWLWCVALGCGYVGARALLRGQRRLALIVFGCSVAATLGLVGDSRHIQSLRAVGGLSLAVAGAVLLLSPLLRTLARRLVRAEKFSAAMRILDVASYLAPGAGAEQERAGVKMLAEVAQGGPQIAIDAIERAKRQFASDDREGIRGLDERIVLLYITTGRWNDAVVHAQTTLGLPQLEQLGQPVVSGDGVADPPATPPREYLYGISAIVWVELIFCVGRIGHNAAATKMLERLELMVAQVPAERITAVAPLRHRARLAACSTAGAFELLERELARENTQHISKTQRAYFSAIANWRRGEISKANTAVAQALTAIGKDSRKRAILDQLASDIASEQKQVPNHGVIEELRQLTQSDLYLPPQVRNRAFAIPVLVGTCVAWAAVSLIAIGTSDDVAAYVQVGASSVGLVNEGQWWRFATSCFVHIGISHLIFNLVAVWVLGRVVEVMTGSLRAIAIFVLGATASTIASWLTLRAGIAAGASGGALALLGAIVAELALKPSRYPRAWRREVSGMLVVIATVQLLADLASLGGLHWGHIAGFGGGIVGMLLVHLLERGTRVANAVFATIVIAFFAATGFGVVQLTAGLAATLTQRPKQIAVMSGASMELPARMTFSEGVLFDADLDIAVRFAFVAETSADIALQAWISREQELAAESGIALGFVEPSVSKPSQWSALAQLVERVGLDSMGKPNQRHLILFALPIVDAKGSGVMVGSFYAADWLVQTHPSVFTHWLGTAGRERI